MMSDAIELKDGNYGLLSAERKSRQIKTRPSSFSAIKNAWNKFRLARLNKKLDKMENALLSEQFKTDSSSKISEKTKSQIEKKTAAIARVEEKILILSREEVPSDYVSKRAIKLKNSMMANLTYNSKNAYSVGVDKKEEIFGSNLAENMNSEEPDINVAVMPNVPTGNEDRIQEVPEDTIEDIMASSREALAGSVQDILKREEGEKAPETDEVDVTSPDLDREHIKEAIDEEFDKAFENKGTIAISPEEVEQVVNGTSGEPESPITSEPEEAIDQESIASALEEAFKGVGIQNEESQGTIETSDIESVVSSELDGLGAEEVADTRVEENAPETGEVEVAPTTDSMIPENNEGFSRDDIKKALEEALAQVHVSQNGSQAAKIDRYDENGEEKSHSDEVKPRERYTYKPMTDEEIRQAQENIEYDKYEDIYHNRITPKTAVETEQFVSPTSRFDVPNFADIFKPAEKPLEPTEEVTVQEEATVDSPVRDFPVIVPERSLPALPDKTMDVSQEEEIEEYTMQDENQEDENLHFDYSETTPKDLKMAFDSVSTLSEVEALKKRARELQEKQRRTKEQMEAAQREAEAAAARAVEAREAARRSYQEYQKRVEKLRMYTEAVQEDCQFNVNKAEMAKKAAEGDERFAAEQQRRAQQNAQMSEEIDAIINPEAINVRRR